MSQLKKLAGQTAIYGTSSILGRILNYFLVPLHTYFFVPDELGTVSVLYGYTALVLILITFGMETTFFRFSTKPGDDTKQSYNVAATAVLLISLLYGLIIYFGADGLANLLPGVQDSTKGTKLIQWLAIIILIDGAFAIPFAKLRIENKAVKFASAKLVVIFANIGLQLLFLIVMPGIINKGWLPFMHQWVASFYDPTLGIEYIFLANLLSNALLIPLLFKELRQIKFSLNKKILQPMLTYAIPLFLMGIAGWFTSELDKVVIASWVPSDGLSTQGVYSQTFKLAALMMLAIQAFKYAAEPFFFSQSHDTNAPALFAKTLHYFTLFALLLLLAISVNIDLLAEIFLRNPAYRVALYLVPIIMFGKLLYGVYINLSIWFKLKDKTMYGLYFTLLGAGIVILANYILLPRIGYLGSALSIVLSYAAMSIACYITGQKYLFIPYNFRPLVLYSIVIGVIVYVSFLIKLSNPFWDTVLNLLIPVLVAFGMYLIEKKKLYSTIN